MTFRAQFHPHLTDKEIHVLTLPRRRTPRLAMEDRLPREAACARGGACRGSRGLMPPSRRSLSSRPPSQIAWSIELCARKQLKINLRNKRLGGASIMRSHKEEFR